MHLKSHSQLLAKLDLSFLEWGGVGWGGTQAGGKANWWLFVARTPLPPHKHKAGPARTLGKWELRMGVPTTRQPWGFVPCGFDGSDHCLLQAQTSFYCPHPRSLCLCSPVQADSMGVVRRLTQALDSHRPGSVNPASPPSDCVVWPS